MRGLGVSWGGFGVCWDLGSAGGIWGRIRGILGLNSVLFGGRSALITCVQSGLIKVWHEDPAEDVSIMGCQLGGGGHPI